MDLTIRTDEDLESDSGLDAGDDRLEFEELDGTDALVPGINFFLLVLKNSSSWDIDRVFPSGGVFSRELSLEPSRGLSRELSPGVAVRGVPRGVSSRISRGLGKSIAETETAVGSAGADFEISASKPSGRFGSSGISGNARSFSNRVGSEVPEPDESFKDDLDARALPIVIDLGRDLALSPSSGSW